MPQLSHSETQRLRAECPTWNIRHTAKRMNRAASWANVYNIAIFQRVILDINLWLRWIIDQGLSICLLMLILQRGGSNFCWLCSIPIGKSCRWECDALNDIPWHTHFSLSNTSTMCLIGFILSSICCDIGNECSLSLASSRTKDGGRWKKMGEGHDYIGTAEYFQLRFQLRSSAPIPVSRNMWIVLILRSTCLTRCME